jgi:Ras-related protein Rab-1A
MGCVSSSFEKSETDIKNENKEKKNNHDFIFKLLIIGDSGVGKSSLLLRFADDIFTESFISTIGVDFRIKTLHINGTIIKLQLWDTSGQERFHTITKSYYREAQGIIVVYDITKMCTFKNVKKWLDEANNRSGEHIKIMLVGNKSDLEDLRVVSTSDGEDMAEELKISFLETSSKDSRNVDETFMMMVKEILKIHLENPPKPEESVFGGFRVICDA